ncbi:MAG: DUF4337 domain-containing protein [Magnetococcales bacterium]|nr:DUF4337 domain-containing protein [Magnetococcales bacterium]
MIHEAGHGDHGGHSGHDQSNSRNKKLAVLISIMACLLSVIEIGGNSAQNSSLSANITAANLWSFFQAKSIRMTTVRSAAEMLETMTPADMPPDKVVVWKKKIADWQAMAQRYDSEPDTGEGRRELAVRAKEAEASRDRALAAYHLYEYAAAALQIGIVLASASAATGVMFLAVGAGGLALLGSVIGTIAWLAPTAIHLVH